MRRKTEEEKTRSCEYKFASELKQARQLILQQEKNNCMAYIWTAFYQKSTN